TPHPSYATSPIRSMRSSRALTPGTKSNFSLNNGSTGMINYRYTPTTEPSASMIAAELR
ncbi:MAG: hypothetical protein JWL95_3215, partial [Gemmatimonadetes bacterium]|nr:hypothetical protein [Gemmatimonadota bacterium]